MRIHLGLVFNNCGTFKDTRVNLADKSKRVLSKLFQSIGYHLPNIKIATRLFDSLIKPILLYGSEVHDVRGAFTVNFEKLVNLVKGNSKTYLKNEIQNVHFQWLRNVLGLNKKKAANWQY